MKTNWEAILALALLVVGVLAFQGGWAQSAGQWVDGWVAAFRDLWDGWHGRDAMLSQPFMIKALVAVVLVSLICGAYSSLVVSNRMAFFSDALAHCAFAGVALGYIFYFLNVLSSMDDVLPVMTLFGMGIGVAIGLVKDKTILSNDTVIGVFFAGAMGLGAILLKPVSKLGAKGSLNPENFLFGEVLAIEGRDLIYFMVLLVATLWFLWRRYNDVVFASFNPSLARSRRVDVRIDNYLFIVLLAVVVNVCLHVVGVLLISALLILPGATAANIARNLRQFFWLTGLVSLVSGVCGLIIAYEWVPVLGGRPVYFGVGGMIVEVGVVLFFASILVSRWVRGFRPALRTSW
jgi:zinc transport system permease protein